MQSAQPSQAYVVPGKRNYDGRLQKIQITKNVTMRGRKVLRSATANAAELQATRQ